MQAGFRDDSYVLREGDVGKTMRARVIARNSRGEATRLTAQSGVVQGPQAPPGPAGVITLPNGEKSIPVTSVPSNERLVVDQAQFSPSPVRSRTEPITVRIKYGYTGEPPQSRADILKHTMFRDVRVHIFAKHSASQWVEIATFDLPRQVLAQ